MPESITPEEKLKNIFLSHPETIRKGEVKYLQYTFWRSLRFAIDPDETIEISEYRNGPLTMNLQERVDERDISEIVGLKIIDTEHGLSSSRKITEVDYLKAVLKVLDQERKAEKGAAIREFFSRPPCLDDNHRPEDL